MQFERKAGQNGKTITISIPQDMAKYLEIQPGDKIILQDEKGKLGPYGSFWKKEQTAKGEMENDQLFD